VVRFLDALAHIDVSTAAPNVRCPTLIVHSRRDIRVPESHEPEPAWSVLTNEVNRFLAS
jgi:hypothetical protein